jgi:hypothetical protein
MGDSVDERAIIGGSIRKQEKTPAVIFAPSPLTFVKAISKRVFSMALKDSIDKISLVKVSVGKRKSALEHKETHGKLEIRIQM